MSWKKMRAYQCEGCDEWEVGRYINGVWFLPYGWAGSEERNGMCLCGKCSEAFKELREEFKKLREEGVYHGECKVVASSTDGLTNDNPKKWFELSCGHTFMLYGLDAPVACPVCGRKVDE